MLINNIIQNELEELTKLSEFNYDFIKSIYNLKYNLYIKELNNTDAVIKSIDETKDFIKNYGMSG